MRPEWFNRLASPPRKASRSIEQMAYPEVQETLGDVLLLPVGATEQHGPHLPINTDTVIASATCAYASALTGAPVMPALPYTVSIGHTEKWPGTFAIFHETLMETVRGIARWAHAVGWHKMLLVNSHFGNDAALRCAVDRTRFDHAGQFQLATRNTWELTAELKSGFSHDAADWHANDAETSLLRFLAPEHVHLDRLSTSDDPDRTRDCVFPHLVAHTSRHGVTGTPSLATAERGAALMAGMGQALAAIIERARLDQPPLPWLRTTTAFSN